MPLTPALALPLMAAAQSQKHVTHNEALLAIDALLHCAVLERDRVGPPDAPPLGARYIVADGATGAWAGHARSIAILDEDGWRFIPPRAGFTAFVVEEGAVAIFDGSDWTPLATTLPSLQNLTRLGIGTAADAANPFAAKLNAALWTAATVAEGGSGDLRYTLNKENAAGVLSLLFQTGFSGRLELGLIGSDDPVVKVSLDGATWRLALTIDAATGGVDFLSREATIASAATTDLGSFKARRLAVTGVATITSFGGGAHLERLVRFVGTPTLVHHATSLILPGAANIATVAGDCAIVASDAAGHWRCLAYQRASGAALVG